MFLGKVITTVSPVLLRNLLGGSVLLSGLALADTGNRATGGQLQRTAHVAQTARAATYFLPTAAPAKSVETAPRLPAASAIRSIKVVKDYQRGGMLQATIELDGQPQYTHFTLPSPYRLVIDVQNVSTEVPNVIPVGLADIKRVRLGKMDDAVRIVFDALKPQPYEINDEGSVIRVWFGEPKADPTLAKQTPPAIQPTPAQVAKPLPAATTTPSRPVLKPVATAAASKPVAVAVNKPAPPTVSNPPVVAPRPVQLPPSPKVFARPSKARLTTSLSLRPPASAVALLSKAMDAPPPARPAKLSAASVAAPVAAPAKTPPAAAKPALAKAAAVPPPTRATTKITATPQPVKPLPTTTETPQAAPVAIARTAPEKMPVARTEPAKTTVTAAPIVAPTATPTGAPIVTPPPPPPREIVSNAPQGKPFNVNDYAKPDYVGEPINLDLRSTQGKTVDIRDFLRFISDTYKVNFVIDQSVRDTPITVTLQSVPWNQAMDALLRANRMGVKVEGSILRVMSQETMALEDRIRQDQMKARQDATPLMTEMVRLNYARALTGAAGGGGGGGAGAGGSSSGGASSGGSASGAGSTAGGSGLDSIIRTRLSQRGNIQADPRTNTLIITDLPENIVAIKDIIAKLDVPEPQVEIESRIVIANRNFARDLGVQLGAVALDTGRGGAAAFGTYPNPISPNVPVNPQSGIGTRTGSGGIFGSITDGLRAAGASSVLGLTLGITGTSQVSAILSAAESKGNVKTISSPRITAQNNQTANIVNGVQIPVQTESNNTLTVTFVTAALRLEITPQINDSGNVLLKVVAENNSVNTAIATRSAPGINTQRAETTVLVPDGGTTIIGGINIDVESNVQQRTPGVSRVPGLGELFKRRTVSRQTDEILFFITPRIYRPLTAPTMTTSGSPK